MINDYLCNRNIGKAIKGRLDAFKMTKAEFSRLIGVCQQLVNRIFDRDTIETKELVKISRAVEIQPARQG